MADRYWVGGTGNWDAADTTHWSASSGGAGGASVPGVGDGVTLDASSGGGTVTMTAAVSVISITSGAYTGTLNTNGQTVTLSSGTSPWSNAGTGTRTINLGASSISLTNGGAWAWGITTNLTFNAGTSTINHTIGNGTFQGGGLTYATVNFTNAVNMSITGVNTFGTLSITGFANKTSTPNLASQTVTGTFTANGNSSVNRMLLRSSPRGTAVTITANAISFSNLDLQDITAAGASAPWNLSAITGLSGDCGGNSNITFTTAVPQYWKHGASASYNWDDSTRWFLATNGGGGAGRVPLPQDTAYFDANSFAASGKTVVQNMTRIGSVDWTGVTNTPTWTTSTVASFFGSITLASGMTLTANTERYMYEGRGSSTVTSAGKQWAKVVEVNCRIGTLTLGDAFSSSTSLEFNSGTFNSAGFSVTVNAFNYSSPSGQTLTMGSSTWTLTGNTNIWSLPTGMTVNSGTSTIRITGAFTSSWGFYGSGYTYYNLEIATSGAFALQFIGSNTFNNIHIDASVAARTLLFTAGTTTTVASMTRDAGTNVITIGSITAASHTLARSGATVVALDYLSVSRSSGTPSSSWYAGTHSTDGGNNSGWSFTSPSQSMSETAPSAAWVSSAAQARLGLSSTAAVHPWAVPPAAVVMVSSGVCASASWSVPAVTMGRVWGRVDLEFVSATPALAIEASDSGFSIEVS